MAAVDLWPKPRREEAAAPPGGGALSSYLGLSFAVFLGLLPKASISYLCSLQSRNRSLALQLLHAEDQIRQMRSRRKEDSKANARVVEIFASHRNAWQKEEKRLLAQIDSAADEVAALRARVEELEASESELKVRVDSLERERGGEDVEVEKEVEMGWDRRGVDVERCEDYCSGIGGLGSDRELAAMYAHMEGLGREFCGSSSKANGWSNLQYQSSLESLYSSSHFMPRRESPWKGGCEATGIPVKLKQVEQELDNLEKLGKVELSIIRKQAKRYQSLMSKIDDLCKRMQAGDHPSELSLSPEFRTQAQTEFLLEACRLQHRATETRQKLTALQAEICSSSISDELVVQAKLDARKFLDSLRIYFKEIQRNLEVWLARIVGDIEGILAREGASRVKDYYFSRYPFGR